MPWVRLEDTYPINRKVAALSDSAFRLDVEAICWAGRELTDGIIVQQARIERKNGDPGVVGDNVLSWTLGGFVRRVGTPTVDLTYWDAAIKEVNYAAL